ncbi:MAG: hypothetical protein WD625_09835 [Balneolales bacterium]
MDEKCLVHLFLLQMVANNTFVYSRLPGAISASADACRSGRVDAWTMPKRVDGKMEQMDGR